MVARSSAPAARLRYEGGECLLYPGKSAKIGRANDSDVLINHPKVSRNHAIIEWDGSGFTVRDLGSSNGTFINGQRVQDVARKLQDGDHIVIYQKDMAFEIIRVGISEPVVKPVPQEPEDKSTSRWPSLLVQSGPDQGQEYPLWGDEITLGRASRDAYWEIRLADRSISRPHASLKRESETYYLVDLGSANGTLLNGTAVTGPMALMDGDIIKLGETILSFQSG